jgi:Plasmid pRiA4b ORF-3-like protein
MSPLTNISPLPIDAPDSLGDCAILRRFNGLTEFYGTGRKLTGTGQPTLADARLLVELLELDDEIDPMYGNRTFTTRSAADLHDLGLTIRWAVRAGALRKVHGRFVATTAWTKASTKKRFERAAEALVSTGPLTLRYGTDRDIADTYTLVDEVVPALLLRAAEGPISVVQATEEVCTDLETRYEFRGWLEDAESRRRTFGRDIDRVARMLDLAGLVAFDAPRAVTWRDPERPLTGTIELSQAGRWWLTHAQLRPRTRFKFEPPPRRSTTVHELHVELDESDPVIWRDVMVPSGFTLRELHRVLQIVMGWEDYHLHQFRFGDAFYTEVDEETEDWQPGALDEDPVQLGEVARLRERFSYEYDFGDSWEHTIVTRSLSPITEEITAEIPRCTAGAGACPPEDVGGIGMYAIAIEAASDPKHRAHEQYAGWLPEDFDPERFDLDEVNAVLELVFSTRAQELARKSHDD